MIFRQSYQLANLMTPDKIADFAMAVTRYLKYAIVMKLTNNVGLDRLFANRDKLKNNCRLRALHINIAVDKNMESIQLIALAYEVNMPKASY